MFPVVESDAERANLVNRVFKLLFALKPMPFFDDLVSNVQSTLVNNIEKCDEVNAKQQLHNGLEEFVTHLSDSASKTLFIQTLNKL